MIEKSVYSKNEYLFDCINNFFVLFHVVSVITYSVLIQGTEFALSNVEGSFINIFFIYLFQWFEIVFIAAISYLLCCVIKGNAVLVLGIGVIIFQKLLVNIESIRRFLPFYISDFNYYNMIPEKILNNTNIVSCIIYGVIIALTFGVALRIWNKRDF